MNENKRLAHMTIRQRMTTEWAKFDTYHAMRALIEYAKTLCEGIVALAVLLAIVLYLVWGEATIGWLIISGADLLVFIVFMLSRKIEKMIEEQRQQIIWLQKTRELIDNNNQRRQ